MQEHNNQTDNQEILNALRFLKDKAEEHSEGIKSLKEDVGTLKGKAEEHSEGIKSLKEDVGTLKGKAEEHSEGIKSLKEDVMVLKEDVGGLKKDVGVLKEDVGTLKMKADEHSSDIKFLKENFTSLQESIAFITETAATHEDIRRLEAKMVTKEYLDDKIADVRGDLVAMTRKEDVKVNTLVGTLGTKKVLSKEEADKTSAMGPFPQLVV